MLNHFVCGTRTFDHQEEHDLKCSSPKKSKRKKSKNNPYSDRGLDKFSALLADLDERRQKVYSQIGPQEISLIRFAYSSNDFVPIVVKVKNNDQKHKSEELQKKHLTSFSEQLEKSSEEATVEERNNKHHNKLDSHNNNNKKKNFSFSWNMLKRPSFYVPAVVIFILVFLVAFGRSVATLCTCVAWYMVPTLSEYVSSKPKKSMMNSKKRDFVKGWLNDMKMMNPEELASPRSGDSKDKSSGKHAHQKSW